MSTEQPAPTRRERARAQTVAEIKAAARRHLVDHGVEGVQLRAIARDLGMTAPALYRYFESHEALLTALVVDLYGELADVVEQAADAVDGDPWDRLGEAARAFRRWSVTHPREFTLLFGSPIPGVGIAPDSPEKASGQRFGQAFGRLFAELWAAKPFPPEELDPKLEQALQKYAAHVGVDLPAPALVAFVSGWVRLYGAVTMEVFGHVSFVLSDAEPLFERELLSIARELGAFDE
jgi:AcrR family transcriptional regulator